MTIIHGEPWKRAEESIQEVSIAITISGTALQSLGRRHSMLLPNKVLESMEEADRQELQRERLGANGALNNKLL